MKRRHDATIAVIVGSLTTVRKQCQESAHNELPRKLQQFLPFWFDLTDHIFNIPN